MGKPAEEKRNEKPKTGLYLIDKTLSKTIYPATCKAKDNKNIKKRLDTTVKDEDDLIHLRPPLLSEDRCHSKRVKNHSDSKRTQNTKSKSPNQLDSYSKIFQSIKLKNNQSTASSTNPMIATPIHSK